MILVDTNVLSELTVPVRAVGTASYSPMNSTN